MNNETYIRNANDAANMEANERLEILARGMRALSQKELLAKQIRDAPLMHNCYNDIYNVARAGKSKAAEYEWGRQPLPVRPIQQPKIEKPIRLTITDKIIGAAFIGAVVGTWVVYVLGWTP